MDIASQANALNKALEDPVPRMDEAPNTVVNLYVGIQDEEGTWHTTAIVRELTGADEEALASLEAKDGLNYSEYMAFLMRRSVVSIGTLQVSDNKAIVDNLIVGDRDKLFMAIVEATYGKVREYQVACTSCGQSNDVFVDITTFPEKPLQKGIRNTIMCTLKDGSEVEVKLPTNGDSLVVNKPGKTTAEQNTLMLARCVRGIEGDPLKWAKSLGMGDRSKLIKAMLESQPGPEIGEVNAQCAHCSKEFAMMLDWVSLLLG
jgi:hypothetical protein